MPNEVGKLFTLWGLTHHLFGLERQALASPSQVGQGIKTYGLRTHQLKLFGLQPVLALQQV
jgi:hypothetical protein